ncbi:MAG: hypothetical protein H0V46_04955 [Sphingomonas sp.]|nr:hypothetical protein [Sphingomonas sp.]
MTTRYQQLRQSISNLAASPEAQLAHIETIFPNYSSPLPSGFNTDELGLGFGEIYCAVGHMLEFGEITQAEIDAAMPLDALLEKLSGKANADFWTCQALLNDPRWEHVRRCAREVLEAYPDEDRESGWTRQHAT